MDKSALAQPAALLEREHEVERVRAARARRGAASRRSAGHRGRRRDREVTAARGGTRAGVGARALRVLSARATELEQGFPFGVVRQLFERPLLEADAGERERWLAGAAALAADVLTGAPATASAAAAPGPSDGDPGYAWQHGLYWLASNLSADSPLALVVDDLQWCDAPSARALAFIARRLEGQPLALILATRPLDPALTPEAATLVADPAAEVLRPSPLTRGGRRRTGRRPRCPASPTIGSSARCLEVTGGNPFLVGELLERGGGPRPRADRGRGSRCRRDRPARRRQRGAAPSGAAGAAGGRARSRAQRARRRRAGRRRRAAGRTRRRRTGGGDGGAGLRRRRGIRRHGPLHPPDPAHGDLRRPVARRARAAAPRGGDDPARARSARPARSRRRSCTPSRPATRRRWRCCGTPPATRLAWATQPARPPCSPAPSTSPRPTATAPRSCSSSARRTPAPAHPRRSPRCRRSSSAARTRTRSPRRRSSSAACSSSPAAPLRERRSCAAPRSGFRPGSRRASSSRSRCSALSSTSASARREADATIAALRDPGGPARDVLQATTLATLAMEEVLNVGSASTAIDLAERAIAAGLPLEPHRGENWAILALAALGVADGLDAALRGTDEILARARERGAALTVVTISALRALIALRRGDLAAAQADAQAAIELAPDLLGARFLVLAVSAAVLAGLERDETPDSLRRLIDRTGVRYDTEFTSSSQLRYASGVLRAAAGNHEAAIEELRGCALDHPAFGGENPAMLAVAVGGGAFAGRARPPRRGSHPGRRRGAPRAVVRRAARDRHRAARPGARRPRARERPKRLAEALAVLEPSPARLEHARVLVDLGATLPRRRTAHRGPGASARGARAGRPLRRTDPGAPGAGRARGDRRAAAQPPTVTGADSLTPSERRVVELAAAGGTNRRDRPDAVRHREDGRDPPRAGVPQARHLVASAASGRTRRSPRLTR